MVGSACSFGLLLAGCCNFLSVFALTLIREKLKQILTLDPNTLLEYKANNQSVADNSTFRNAKAYVFAAE